MNTTDRAPLIAIAMLAARADGRTDSAEQAAVEAVVARLGSPDVSRLAEQVAGGQLRAADLAGRLSDDEARRTAYDGALAICNADGPANPDEQAFLEQLPLLRQPPPRRRWKSARMFPAHRHCRPLPC